MGVRMNLKKGVDQWENTVTPQQEFLLLHLHLTDSPGRKNKRSTNMKIVFAK